MFELVFLGTSASAPSVQRGLSAAMVLHREYRFLIDCGEGTQRQILRSGLGFKRLERILLTHGHLDHILGLGGLASTFGRWEAIEEMEIWGGAGALNRVRELMRVVFGAAEALMLALVQLPHYLDEVDAGRDGPVADANIGLARAEHHPHQLAHPAQRPRAAPNLHLLDGLPPAEGGRQSAQPQDVIQMAVGQQNALQPLEAQPAAEDLALRALAAVDQKTILAMHHHRRRQPALDRRGRGRSAEENEFEHGIPFETTDH